MEPRRNLYTIGQASEYLGVSIDTLRRWEKNGRIEAFRSPGGHRYYERDDLDKLFGKRYVHQEKQKQTEHIEVPPEAPQLRQVIEETTVPSITIPVEEPEPVVPPAPTTQEIPVQREIKIPDVSPIQVSRRVEVIETQVLKPIVNEPIPSVTPPQADNFLVPQLSFQNIKEKNNTLPQNGQKGSNKEMIQVIIIGAVLVLVIILAIVLVIMMVKSSQSVLSPTP
jgi:excisionase family DNA binding protein